VADEIHAGARALSLGQAARLIPSPVVGATTSRMSVWQWVRDGDLEVIQVGAFSVTTEAAVGRFLQRRSLGLTRRRPGTRSCRRQPDDAKPG
jgi:hypothetical protein